LVDLHEKFRDEGFEILAFPCDQFGDGASMEPRESNEIR
jgi:glutathione peroxidase